MKVTAAGGGKRKLPGQAGEFIGEGVDLLAADHLYGQAARLSKVAEQLAEFAAGHIVFIRVGQDGQSACRLDPINGLLHAGPELFNIANFARA